MPNAVMSFFALMEPLPTVSSKKRSPPISRRRFRRAMDSSGVKLSAFFWKSVSVMYIYFLQS